MMEDVIPNIKNVINHIEHKWFSKEVVRTVNFKHKCFFEYKQHYNDATLIRYIEVQNRCKCIIRQAKENMKEALVWLVRII